MSLTILWKTGILIGNVAFLTGGYVLAKMLYKNYLNLKNESKRLKQDGQSNYQYLVDAFKDKVGEVVEIENLSFIGTTQPISNDSYVKSKVNNKERYICVQGVLKEYGKNVIQTQWIQLFNLTENDHKVIIQVKNKESFMPNLFKSLSAHQDNQIGAQVKEAFSVDVTEKGIAFGTNLYVFGKFIKTKLGQFKCVDSKLICDAKDAASQTQTYSYAFLVGASCVVAFSLIISGICLYFTFGDDQKNTQKQKKAIKG
ncbi:unnamed protein product [Paramecium sonneborni]|uniref:Uncharacterized protein n=1 Tax=Paramecium sonneborni TaxID=65129 RepID=A0A8S1QTY4_9CILI|nr:unnamed protein product [Paramecium sonneborni]